MTASDSNRRALKTRSKQWAQQLAREIDQRNLLTPNQISLLSIGFALVGSWFLYAWPFYSISLVICAIFIQLRLLCNLIDGMVAIEGGKKTPNGVLYNEIPDRVADSVFIVALGYAVGYAWLGWLAALLAMCTAYIRTLGGAVGLEQSFRGPLAKPHRMAVLTLVCLLGAIEWPIWHSQYALLTGLIVMAVGSLLTCVLRSLAISKQLNQQQG